MAKFDFHKVSQSSEVEVYQAMQLLKTKTNDVTGETPRRYSPQTLKSISGDILTEVLEVFKGYDVRSVQLSKDDGVVVRVARAAGDDYEVPEPGVERLVVKGGDK